MVCNKNVVGLIICSVGRCDSLSLQDLRTLPALQVENAKYVKAKEKDCLFGAMGALLRSSEVDTSKFTSFIFLTSAVRGPFLPPHVKVRKIYVCIRWLHHSLSIRAACQPVDGHTTQRARDNACCNSCQSQQSLQSRECFPKELCVTWSADRLRLNMSVFSSSFES